MKTQNLIQGSAEWLAYRATHFNASDAPAMLGVSPYKTRTELLHELHTGLTPDVDQAKQRLFDAGHAAEAAARPLAEEILGEELYPVTGSEGRLSASFDGLTMNEGIVWEHKLMNADLARSLDQGVIPTSYHPQLEQQLLVSGADRTLFMATNAEGTAMECVWYYPNPELRSAIIQGWAQFAIDLAAYVPTETVAAPQGRTPEALPALHIEVTGMVTASNLAEYKAHALAVFGSINRELVTDQDFASAESTVKWCADIESRLAAAKQHALSQTESIDTLFRTIDDISAEARATRLELDKLVKTRKDSIRSDIVTDGRNAIAEHVALLNVRIGRPLLPTVPVDFANAIKGKRTLDSMRDAAATELARAKIAANEIADRITVNLRTIQDHAEFDFLFADVAALALKEPEFVAMAIKNRIGEHKAGQLARLEAQRASIRAEEQAKAEKDAREKVLAEQAAADKLAREQAAEAARAAEAAKIVQEPAMTLAVVPAAITHEAVVQIMMPATVRQAMAPKPATAPTMSLGEISTRLGFNVTSAFLASLGFEATTVKAAKLFHEEDFTAVCRALIEHIESVCELQAA